MVFEIKKIDKVLGGVNADKEIECYKSKNLLGAGENYGSVMLAVDIKFKNSDEELHLVVKMCPPTQFIKDMFNIPVTFKKEVIFYNTIIPTLKKYCRENGCREYIDFIPKCYGSRISLDPEATEVDDDACILMENIKMTGFQLCDRLKGFDFEAAKLLIKDLATFHAVPIGLKMTNISCFREKVTQHLPKYTIMNDDIIASIIEALLEVIKKNIECTKYLKQIESSLWKSSRCFSSMEKYYNSAFATLIHSDLWVNNMMIKYEKGKPVKNAMVDFQLVDYGNPANDLIFFIYSSLSNNIISNHYDDLINLYYKTFIEVLKSLNVKTHQFSYEKFLEEINNAAKGQQFFHILFMIKPILTKPVNAKNLGDMNESDLFEMGHLSSDYYSKVWFTILDFIDKGWV